MNVDRMRRYMERDQERRDAQWILRARQARLAAMTPEHRAAHERGVLVCQTCLNEDMARTAATMQRVLSRGTTWNKGVES